MLPTHNFWAFIVTLLKFGHVDDKTRFLSDWAVYKAADKRTSMTSKHLFLKLIITIILLPPKKSNCTGFSALSK